MEANNNQKLREALAAYLALWDNGTMNSIDELKQVIKQMRQALSAPPRNCDLVEGHTADDEFEKAMGFPPSKTADERDKRMRENWFLFKAWLFAEAKGGEPQKGSQND